MRVLFGPRDKLLNVGRVSNLDNGQRHWLAPAPCLHVVGPPPHVFIEFTVSCIDGTVNLGQKKILHSTDIYRFNAFTRLYLNKKVKAVGDDAYPYEQYHATTSMESVARLFVFVLVVDVCRPRARREGYLFCFFLRQTDLSAFGSKRGQRPELLRQTHNGASQLFSPRGQKIMGKLRQQQQPMGNEGFVERMFDCCLGHERSQQDALDVVGGDDAEHGSGCAVSIRKPPNDCPGYPVVLIPPFLTEDEKVDFFLPYQDDSDNDNKRRRLACSLVRCMENATGNDRQEWTSVQGQNFDIDSSKPVIILCHGFLSWRNQMLIAFLASKLSRKLQCHTLRFDFTGNGHSTGTFSYGNYNGEARDLKHVIQFVRNSMKCKVSCVIGHSKGSYSVLRRAWEQEEEAAADRIPYFVNLSGRYAIPNEFDIRKRFNKEQAASLESNGRFLLSTRGQRRLEVTNDDIEERMNLDSSPVKCIRSAQVLTIHGSADDMVDVSNAYKFSQAIVNHELCIIEGADHNFNGLLYMDHLVAAISSFISNAGQDPAFKSQTEIEA